MNLIWNLLRKWKQRGKDFAKPLAFAISWTHSPVASKLGASPLKQSRHNGEFHLMKLSKLSRCFASELFPTVLHIHLKAPYHIHTAANAMLFLYAGRAMPCHCQSCQISWAVVPWNSRTTDFLTKPQYASCLSSGTSASFSSKNFSFRVTFSFLCSLSAILSVVTNNSLIKSFYLPFLFSKFCCRDAVLVHKDTLIHSPVRTNPCNQRLPAKKTKPRRHAVPRLLVDTGYLAEQRR